MEPRSRRRDQSHASASIGYSTTLHTPTMNLCSLNENGTVCFFFLLTPSEINYRCQSSRCTSTAVRATTLRSTLISTATATARRLLHHQPLKRVHGVTHDHLMCSGRAGRALRYFPADSTTLFVPFYVYIASFWGQRKHAWPPGRCLSLSRSSPFGGHKALLFDRAASSERPQPTVEL